MERLLLRLSFDKLSVYSLATPQLSLSHVDNAIRTCQYIGISSKTWDEVANTLPQFQEQRDKKTALHRVPQDNLMGNIYLRVFELFDIFMHKFLLLLFNYV